MSFYRTLSAIVDVLITLVTALLGLRVVMHLFGANTGNAFVSAIYSLSAPLVAPFAGIFPSLTLDDGFVVEFSAIFALLMYAVIAHIILTVIRAMAYAAFRRRHIIRREQLHRRVAV